MRRKKLITIGSLVLVLLLALFVWVSCAKPAPAPTPAPSPAPAPAPTPTPPAVKPIELKFSTFIPPVDWFQTDIYAPWVKEIEARTNGRVKITIYPAESLGKLQDQYSMALSGQADIALVDLGGTPGVFPLSEMISLPLLFSTTDAAAATWWELSEKYLLNTEYKKVKLLWQQNVELGNIQTSKKPVHTLEDFAGMKFAVTQPACVGMVEKLGGTAVFFPIVEIYTALERGIVDGNTEGWYAQVNFKFLEVTKYRTAVKLFSPTISIVMNLDAWNSLPPDIQQIFNETTGMKLSRKSGAGHDALGKRTLENVIMPYDKEKGNPEVYYLPDTEKARWREACVPLYEEWIAAREAKGLPARVFFNDLLQIAAKYNK